MKIIKLLNYHPKCFLCKLALLLSFILVLTTTDLIVKEVANRTLKEKPDVVVIPGFWHYKFVVNDDLGFSILNWTKKYLSVKQKWIFLVFLQGMGATVVIIFFFHSQTLKQLVPLCLIVSGALGNLIDRIMRGFVVDYVMWFYKDFVWPIFNLADVYTVIGAFLLFIVIFFFSKEEMQKQDEKIISQITDEERENINKLDENINID